MNTVLDSTHLILTGSLREAWLPHLTGGETGSRSTEVAGWDCTPERGQGQSCHPDLRLWLGSFHPNPDPP